MTNKLFTIVEYPRGLPTKMWVSFVKEDKPDVIEIWTGYDLEDPSRTAYSSTWNKKRTDRFHVPMILCNW